MNPWEGHGVILSDRMIEDRMGARIDEGSSRVAYEYTGDSRFIIKRAIFAPPSDNIIEWSIWRLIRQSPLGDRFGEIFAVSESGRYLVMERLDSITLADYASTPDIPPWLGDVKPAAFGKSASGFVKVRDYGSLKLDVLRLVRNHWQRD